MTELQHQANVIKWSQQPSVRERWPELALLYHAPNGGKRDPIEAKHFKAIGVKSGVPDLFLPSAHGGYHGLYIEMKTENGRLSESQRWWGEQLRKQGYSWAMCRSWEAAVQVLEMYLSAPTW